MYEEVTPALVLASYPSGEMDVRVSLFTRDLGKLTALVVSGKKITSKLTPHLQEGSLTVVRVIEQQGIRIADALTAKEDVLTLEACRWLDQLLPDHVIEDDLWSTLVRPRIDWSRVLAILGWDPQRAACHVCTNKSRLFLIRTQEFFCDVHAPHPVGFGEVIPLESL